MAEWTFGSALFYDRGILSLNFTQTGEQSDSNGLVSDGQANETFTFGNVLTTEIDGTAITGVFGGTVSTETAQYVLIYTGFNQAVLLSPADLAQTLADPDLPEAINPLVNVEYAPFVVCFTAGTMIATPGGARAVETLQAGDLVLTADGRQVPVRWLGRQTIATRFVEDHLTLVRIAAGALGRELPDAELTVTADHAMLIDGLLCQAAALVNGTTIRSVPATDLPDRLTVYHVELDAHEVILANGAETESYVDMAPRSVFDNFAETAARKIPEMDLPRVHSPRQLPAAIRARLGLTRAA